MPAVTTMTSPTGLEELSNRQLGNIARQLTATGKLADPQTVRGWALRAQVEGWRLQNPGYAEVAEQFVALEGECEERGLEVHWDADARRIAVRRVTVEEF